MGSKGQQQSTTNQSQTYTPNQVAGDAITQALQRAQQTAQLPYNVPQAPVAGFSQQQQQAFDITGQAQGMAQPYINQAANYFSPQGAQAFLNPYASNVMAGLKDVFGQQASQQQGQLTQAAGGIGADRIAVGQSELAKQQDLAAGQTLSGLYQNAVQQAQGAGYGTASLGSQAQNATLQGAQALLGTGGLQQQLSQAQLNAPYQQQVAQAAFPYQQAQFLAGITGSLAPGLGGTTAGTGTTSQQYNPSLWGQIGGGLTALGGVGGYLGSGSKGGNANTPGWASAQLQNNAQNPAYGPGFAEGGAAGDDPIDISAHPFIPTQQLAPIQPHIPQLNLNPPQQQSGGGGKGSGVGDVIGTGLKIAGMLARGGAVNPYARGGYADGSDVSDADRAMGTDLLRQAMQNKYGVNPNDPIREPDQPAVNAWRTGVDTDLAQGVTAQGQPAGGTALAFAPQAQTPPAINAINKAAGTPNPYAGDTGPQDTAGASASGAGPADTSQPAPTGDTGLSLAGFLKSPYAALTLGGLEAMRSGSLASGLATGMKTFQGQETADQAAKRLAQEAKFHEDQYNRIPLYQQKTLERQQAQDDLAERRFNRPYEELTAIEKENVKRQAQQDELAKQRFDRPYNELTKNEQAQLEESKRQHELARIPQGFRQKEDGTLEPIGGGPHSPEQIKAEADAKRLPAMNREDMAPMVDAYYAGDHSVLTGVGRGTQGPQNIQQFWGMLAEKLRNDGADGKQLAAAKANFMAQSAGLRVAAQREAQIETAVNEAKGTFPEVLRTSAALPRTEYTPVNQALQYFRSKTGSPAQRSYGAAIQAAITAYSQAMNRTGANSVFAQQHAEELLAKADGPQAIASTIKQLDIEMGIAQRAPEETRQAILNRILNIKTDQAQPPPAAGASGTTAPARTITRQGTVNSGPNAGKKIIEYSDGTREYQ